MLRLISPAMLPSLIRPLRRASLLLAAAPLLLTGACTPDPLDLDMPAHTPKMALASAIGVSAALDTILNAPDSALVITVSRSIKPRDLPPVFNGAEPSANDAFMLLNHMAANARVELTGGGRRETLLMAGPGVYLLERPMLQPNAPYTVTVYDSVWNLGCQSTATYLTGLDFDYVRPKVQRSATDTVVTLSYQISLQPDGKYYLVEYAPVNRRTANRANLNNARSLMAALQNEQRLRLLTEADFRDGRFTVTDERLAVQGADSLVLGVSKVSEEYFRFLQAYRKGNSTFNRLSGEPINYPTNVHDGYGFFTLHTLTARLIDLTKY